MTLAAVDYGDVQGLVRYGYAHMTEARFLLLRIKDPRAARAWLRAAPVTPATRTVPRPETALQVALTRDGLETLGVPAGVLARLLRRVPHRAGGRGEPLAPAGRHRPEQPGGLAVGRPRERPPRDGPALRRAGAARALDIDGDPRSAGQPPSRSSRARCRRSSTAWSHSGSSTASASRRWTGSSAGTSTEGATCSSTATSWRSARSSWATRTSTGSTPTARSSARTTSAAPTCCRPPTRPTCATSARTAATSSSASSARTPRDSGSSCAGRRTAIPRRGAPWPRRWWAAR